MTPPTITLHRTTAIWSAVAVLLLWIASIGWAVDVGQETAATDNCYVKHAADEGASER